MSQATSESSWTLSSGRPWRLRGRTIRELASAFSLSHRSHLIIAYERLAENRETLAELRARARHTSLERQVVFLKSVPEQEPRALVLCCVYVVHTATQEHFGYVPLEAMAAGHPVVVANRGGPAETVVDGVAGFVRPPTPPAFADALARLITDPIAAQRMGRAGRAHVAARFSRDAFGIRLERLLERELGTDDERERISR